MNILHLKYAVEIANTRSISQAAENLYMGQPNLSRAIKELETNLGITVFNRTTKGISVTPEGEEFLRYARRILEQVEEVETFYQKGRKPRQTFSICVPRASYISAALSEFAKTLNQDQPTDIFYQETDSQRAIQHVINGDYRLAIVRYQLPFERYFETFFEEKKLSWLTVTEYQYLLLMSEHHPMADQKEIHFSDLANYIEISHMDQYVPAVPVIDVKRAELSQYVDKHIYVFDRGSQFELLEKVPNTFMWVSAVPGDTLQKYHLVQRSCVDNQKIHRDVLIFRNDYRLTEMDRSFIAAVRNAKYQYMTTVPQTE